MPEDGNSRLGVVIVSGLSGAGKTVALRALEDTGFFCIDNLPVTLIESFLSTIKSRVNSQNVGIGVDIREKTFLGEAYRIISSLKERYSIEILFLEAEKEVDDPKVQRDTAASSDDHEQGSGRHRRGHR